MKTIKQIAKIYNRPTSEFRARSDGRIEWVCKHGIGHTVYAPAIKQADGSYYRNYRHGCDGCCSKLSK